MSQTAQKKDLSDSFEIYSFCLKCEMDRDKIKLLYLLTVADINGTNKKIWNNWKANLLLELYKKSLNFLSSNQSEKKTHNIEKIKKNIIITRGEKGAISINHDEIIEVNAQSNLKIKDLTGAGDLFAAGYLHGIINNFDTKECLIKGTELSSKIIQKIGARI